MTTKTPETEALALQFQEEFLKEMDKWSAAKGGLTDSAIAEAAGITPSMLSQMRTDKRIMSLHVMFKIASVFGKTPSPFSK